MVHACSMQLSRDFGIRHSRGCKGYHSSIMGKGRSHFSHIDLSSHFMQQDAWSLHVLNGLRGPIKPVSSRCNVFVCRSVFIPSGANHLPVLKNAAVILTRSYDAFRGGPQVLQLIPAMGVIAFAVWGLGPIMRLCRTIILRKNDSTWNKSNTHYVTTSYLQPLLLWTGATLICRALDPVVLPSEASQAVKQRILIFLRSLSTVLSFAYCLSSLIQQARKTFVEKNDSADATDMGFNLSWNAIYYGVWIAALSLFMELLGFSTQKWLTAGGLGTVLITLAGREIFENFLSGVMLHVTQPFIANEWIQTNIGGYEVSGVVEHVGWWSPTIVRGDDREAIHIPNHKFNVSVVRNLSQKTHWRIKTHLAISHLDVHKIDNIVADMRKVIAKNPQVEQKGLHRRVFLENINPENQALMILVSCFVKTSRIEEYFCVKEEILLDLLRVISHHRARLATPIRTVQEVYSEAAMENVPFADTIFSRSRSTANRPYLLIEPRSKVNGDDKGKASTHTNEEKDAEDKSAVIASGPKVDAKVETTSTSSSIYEKQHVATPPIGKSPLEENIVLGVALDGSKRTNEEKDAEDKAAVIASVPKADVKVETTSTSSSIYEKQHVATPSIGKSPLEENIVLSVALDGSKRTLPIDDDEMSPSPPASVESKEVSSGRNGSPVGGQDKRDGSMTAVPSATD